jgi:hypothetical protein
VGVDWQTSLALRAADLACRRPFLRAARAPRRTQEQALRRILTANAATAFGHSHGFEGLRSLDAFRAAVPVQTYDSLKDAIRTQAELGVATLTREPPVFYARTSGTTGPARDFPVTATAQQVQRTAQKILAASIHRCSNFFRGTVAGFGGAYVEGQLPSGQPFGSASGQTHATTPSFVHRKLVVSSAAQELHDPLEKYHLYALCALRAPDLTGLIAANPSTFVSVMRHIETCAEAVLRDLTQGSFTIGHEPSPAASAAAGRAAPCPGQARRLQAALAGPLRLDAIWPHLSALASWTGGNCRPALDRLTSLLPPAVRTIEIGYRASEFVGTINVDAASNLCLPDVRHTIFEFVEQDQWERGDADFRWLDEIEETRRYYIFATTVSGLYRYHINDVVEVAGHFAGCPGLRFVQKGQGVTSITGEKLHESQLLEAVRWATAAAGLRSAFFMALADPAEARYRLFYETEQPRQGLAETLSAGLDRSLSALNIEYAAKRGSDRLHAPCVTLLAPGAGEALKRHMIANGQREAQCKLPVLADAGRWRFDFAPYAWEALA